MGGQRSVLTMLLGPVVLAVFLGRRGCLGVGLPTRMQLGMVLPLVLCAWTGLQAGFTFLNAPQGMVFPWAMFWSAYLTGLQWLWPTGLAALAFCLSPQRVTPSATLPWS